MISMIVILRNGSKNILMKQRAFLLRKQSRKASQSKLLKLHENAKPTLDFGLGWVYLFYLEWLIVSGFLCITYA